MQTTLQATTYEQTLVGIARALPPERVAQLVDFARFLQVQQVKARDQDALAGFAGEKERTDEALWRTQFAGSLDVLEQLASEALAEDRAGKTLELDPESL